MASPEEIYAHVMSLGEPSQFAAPWQSLKPSATFRDLKLSATEIKSELLGQFQSADLFAAGVFVGPVTNPHLSPLFRDEPLTLFPVLRFPKGRPFDIVGGHSYSMSGAWAVTALKSDYRHKKSRTRLRGRMLVVPEMIDAAILQQIGVVAVPAKSLHGLSGRGISALREGLALKVRLPLDGQAETWPLEVGPNPNGPLPETTTPLTFANWSLARLDTADVPNIIELTSDFERMETVFGFDLTSFRIWKPSGEEVAAIEFAIQRGAQIEYTIRAIFESVLRNSKRLDSSKPPIPIHDQFRQDVARMFSDPSRSGRDDKPRQDRDEYLARIDRELVEPLRGMASRTSDPIGRQRIALLCELAPMSQQLLHELRLESAGTTDGGPPHELSPEKIKTALAIFDQTLKLMETISPARRS